MDWTVKDVIDECLQNILVADPAFAPFVLQVRTLADKVAAAARGEGKAAERSRCYRIAEQVARTNKATWALGPEQNSTKIAKMILEDEPCG